MRADKFFAEKFGSRTKASDALKRGQVLKNNRPLAPDDNVEETDEFYFLSESNAFVSNGGFKLARGLDFFQESVAGGIFADLGASTGGFCDCLLQRGAKKVYCVDVGENQLDKRIANSPQVVVMDRTNARYLKKSDFTDTLDGVTSDLSFISLKLVLPAVSEILPSQGRAFVLFKPQFECVGQGMGKSGILPVRRHANLLDNFYDFTLTQNLAPVDIVNAPIREKKNVEYIVFLKKDGVPIPKHDFLTRATVMYENKNL